MKKQNVSLKKLSLSKSNVANVGVRQVIGGSMTDNGCGPEMSVWPNICPVSHNCPPATNNCPTTNCQSFACGSVFCNSVVCQSAVCASVGIC